MSIILKAGAGLVAGALAGGVGFVFWPHVEPGIVSSRPAVEKPVFVVAAEPARPIAAPPAIVVSAPASQGSEGAGLIKLAAALRADSAPASTPAALMRGVSNVALKTVAPSDEAAKFRALGLVALADGNVADARAFLERAADEGDTRALLVLGDTFDPATLKRLGAMGIRGDSAQARDYYSRALAAGVGAARQRIATSDARGD